MSPSPPPTPAASPSQMKTKLETMLAYPFDCTLTFEAYEQVGATAAALPACWPRARAWRCFRQCLSQCGHWSKCQAPRDALDACVELGEKRRFRVETEERHTHAPACRHSVLLSLRLGLPLTASLPARTVQTVEAAVRLVLAARQRQRRLRGQAAGLLRLRRRRGHRECRTQRACPIRRQRGGPEGRADGRS